MTTLIALFNSRKFWVGTITVAAIVGALALRIAGKIEAADLIATITAISTVGLGVIGSIAWEDTAGKRLETAKATQPAAPVENSTTVNVGGGIGSSKSPPPLT